MNAITKHEGRLPALQMDETELMGVLQSSLYPGADPASIKMVLGYCKAAGLDPMQKPVHIVPMWDSKAKRMRDVIMPGVGSYRVQAARNGCAGVGEPEFGPDVTEEIGGVKITYPAWCRVTAKRRLPSGEMAEFTAKELWRENYATAGKDSVAPNAMWKKRPYGQLAKCAEAQVLRKAFPEIGSEPTADEMAGKALNEFDIDASTGEIRQPTQAARPALPPYSPDDFANNIDKWRGVIQSGRKSPDDLIAMVGTKGVLSEQQKQAIRDLAIVDAEIKSETQQPATAGDGWDEFTNEE